MTKLLPLVALIAASFSALAADFPLKDKPITLVVPFSAGGPTDRVARDLSEALRKQLGTSVVIENAAGAGSSIGAAKVARATPDGHTLLVNHCHGHHAGPGAQPAVQGQ